MTSSSDAFFLICVHRSIANIVLLLLKIDVSDDIKADNITASIIPRAPELKQLSLNMTNQLNECAPCEDSYQSRHLPSLIRVFAVLNLNVLQLLLKINVRDIKADNTTASFML